MIHLSNGHSFDYMVASGALAFDGKGWPWEHPVRWLGLLRPELFTVVMKTVTREPRKGNLRWLKPWQSVSLLTGGGAVNKIGLTNPGVEWWCEKVGPRLDFERQPFVASIYGSVQELVEMTEMFNEFGVVAIEVNPSCPNTGTSVESAQAVIDGVQAVREVSKHPVLAKLSAAQDYLHIASELEGAAEALSINSVPWELIFPEASSPLHRLERRVGGGGGGVSGVPAQEHNWKMVEELAALDAAAVIGPSVMSFDDVEKVRERGAKAISFGAIHLRRPWAPTSIVIEDQRRRAATTAAPAQP